MKALKWLLGLSLVGIGGLTGTYFYIQYKLLNDMEVSYKGVSIPKLSLNKVSLKVLLGILNKSDIAIEILNQTYHVYVNNSLITTIKSDRKLALKAKAESNIPVNVEFNPSDVLFLASENILSLLSDKSKIIIKIVGDITINTGVFKGNIPVLIEDNLDNMVKSSK